MEFGSEATDNTKIARSYTKQNIITMNKAFHGELTEHYL